MTEITILLGSNVSPETNVPRALTLLRQFGRIVRASHVWETPPIACKRGGRFYNAIVVLESSSNHAVWKAQIIPKIEDALGRKRDPLDKCAPRTIDLDLLEVPHKTDKLPFIPQLIGESCGDSPSPGTEMVKVLDRAQVLTEPTSQRHKAVEDGSSNARTDSTL